MKRSMILLLILGLFMTFSVRAEEATQTELGGGTEEKLTCKKGEYITNNRCEKCPAGYQCDGTSIMKCPANSVSGYTGASSCSSCGKKYANFNKTKCCEIKVKSISGVPSKASVGSSNSIKVVYESSCKLAPGISISASASASFGSTSVAEVGDSTIIINYTPTVACKESTIYINVAGYEKSFKVQTRPNWTSIQRYYSKSQPTMSKEEADGQGKDWFISGCSSYNKGYKCTYNYRGCGGIGHPDGCYYNTSLETMRWIKGNESKVGYSYLEGVPQEKCINKCRSNDSGTAEKVDDGNHNVCSANVDFKDVEFSTQCVNDNSIIIHNNHPSLYTITCTEKLNYNINYRDLIGNTLKYNESTVKQESGIKVDTVVTSEINCKGDFDTAAYQSDQEVIRRGSITTGLENEYFWRNVLSSYREKAAQYNVWIKHNDYVNKVNDTENETFISYDNNSKKRMVNADESSSSGYSNNINVVCTSVNCMAVYNPNFKDFDVTFNYRYKMKLPVSIYGDKNIGNAFLVDKKLVKDKQFALEVKGNNMGYFHNLNYEIKCLVNVDDTIKYRIIDEEMPLI